MRYFVRPEHQPAKTARHCADSAEPRLNRRQVLGMLATIPLVQDVAAASADRLHPVGTDRTGREDAIRAIPFHRLEKDAQAKLRHVVQNAGVYRRMPIQIINSDADMFLFLVRHPEVMVGIWELMGISSVKLTRTGRYTFEALDGMGTKGSAELVYGDRHTHIVYGRGSYEGKLFRRRLTGSCVLILQSVYENQDDPRTWIANRLDLFLHVDNAGIELLARTLQPFFGRTADANFSETAKFVQQVSHAAEHNSGALQHLALRLDAVDAPIREQFTQMIATVNQRAAGSHQRNTGASSQGDGKAALPKIAQLKGAASEPRGGAKAKSNDQHSTPTSTSPRPSSSRTFRR